MTTKQIIKACYEIADKALFDKNSMWYGMYQAKLFGVENIDNIACMVCRSQYEPANGSWNYKECDSQYTAYTEALHYFNDKMDKRS